MGSSIPQVQKGIGGGTILLLPESADYEQQVEWIARGLLTFYGMSRGIETPPPLWLIHAVEYLGAGEQKPQMRTLLIRRLKGKAIPSLSHRVRSFDRTSDAGWDFLLFRFLESGGLAASLFKQRVEQFWSNGYDWTQLGLFFTGLNSGLNGAELELLWKTYVTETLESESAVCLSEEASLAALEALARLEVLVTSTPEMLPPNTWFLYRDDPVARAAFSRKHAELEVLALSIHPYYFNACHSLDRVFRAIAGDGLDEYRDAVKQWNQDLLDAQQLSYETDRLLQKLCPEQISDLF